MEALFLQAERKEKDYNSNTNSKEITDEADKGKRSKNREHRRDFLGGLPMYVDPYDLQLVEAIVTATFKEEDRESDFKSLFSIFLLQASSGLQLRDKLDQRVPFFFIQQQISLLQADESHE